MSFQQEDEAKKPEKPEKISSPKLEGKRQLVRGNFYCFMSVVLM